MACFGHGIGLVPLEVLGGGVSLTGRNGSRRRAGGLAPNYSCRSPVAAAGRLAGLGLLALALGAVLLPAAASAQSDTTPPTMTFNPVNGGTAVVDALVVTVTFSEAVYSDSSQTEFTKAQLASLVTLKRDDADGNDVPFNVLGSGLRSSNTVLEFYPHPEAQPGELYVSIGDSVSFYDAAGNAGAQASITFTGVAAPPPSKTVIVSATSASVLEEDGTTIFSLNVKLGAQPSGNVTVALIPSSDANTTGNACVSTNKVCIDSDLGGTQTNTSFTFTTLNWKNVQWLHISGHADSDSRNERITLTLDPSGADYGSAPSTTVEIVVVDDDKNRVFSSTEVLTVNEGSLGTFTARLTDRPTGTVSVALTSSSPAVTLSPTSLSFTTGNWNSARTVTVNVAEDVNTRDETVYLTLDPSGADYASSRTSSVELTVKDNGKSGLIVSETTLAVNESGSGNTDTFTVKLSENPTSDVKVAIGVRAADWKPVDGGKRIATADKNRLTFTSENGTTAQTVTITGVVDRDDAGETGTVHVTATGGDFTGLSEDIKLTVTDNSSDSLFQVLRGGKALSHVTSGPATVTANVRLLARPAGVVTLTPTVSPSGSVTASIADNGIFTPQNWHVAKALTITIGSNVPSSGVTVTLTAAGSSEFAAKTRSFKVFNATPPTATIGSPGPNNVVTVTFSKAVGTCPTVTQAYCSGTVTAYTSTTVDDLFELVVGSEDDNTLEVGDAVPFTAAISGNVVTITPTVPTGAIALNLLVKDRYWSVGGGVVGSTVLKRLVVQRAQVGNAPPISPSDPADPPPLPPVPLGNAILVGSPSSDADPEPLGPSDYVGQTIELRHDNGRTVGCLDVTWAHARDGQNVQTWECNGTDAQKWLLEQRTAGDHAGRYRLVSALANGRTFCLDNRGEFRDSYRLDIWTCVADTHPAAANQTFDLAASGDGYTLTFTSGSDSSVMWAERAISWPRGNVGQRSGGTGNAAEWLIVRDGAPVPGS